MRSIFSRRHRRLMVTLGLGLGLGAGTLAGAMPDATTGRAGGTDNPAGGVTIEPLAEGTGDNGDPTLGTTTGRIIVKLAPAAAARAQATNDGPDAAPASIDRVPEVRAAAELVGAVDVRALDRAGLSSESTLVATKANADQTTAPPADNDLYLVTVTGDEHQAADVLATTPGVEYAEPEFVRTVQSDEFSDPARLWGVAKVNAAAAWARNATGAGVVVAVIDSGVDLTHPDLASNAWINADEIDGNGIDDDGNGYVDDINGWDFVGRDATPDDGHGHGTHVAGTIAAARGNGRGVVGVAPGARLMALRGLDANGSGSDGNLALALRYAADNGAQVINNSWGGFGASQTVSDAIAYAHAKGVVVVSAAGNSTADTCGFMPADNDRTLTVAASGASDQQAPYSNFGTKIDVAAPGGTGTTPTTGILSTVPMTSTLGTQVPMLAGAGGEQYMAISGTSMASPHVAGLAALLIGKNPGWTNEQIRQAIRTTTDDVNAPGADIASGSGRINADRATQLTVAPPAAEVNQPASCSKVTGDVAVVGSAGAAFVVDVGAGDVPTSWNIIANGTGPVRDGVLASWSANTVTDGRYTIRVRTTDTAGRTSEDRNVVVVDNVHITSPARGALVSRADGRVAVRGLFPDSSGSSVFQSYELAWAAGPAAAATDFTTFATGTTSQPADAVLGDWPVSTLPDGEVTVRLSVKYSTHVSVETTTVTLDALLRSGFPADAASGWSYMKKSPIVVDLDGDRQNEIVLGSTARSIDGTVKPGWPVDPGIGRSNPAILDVNGDGDLEVVAIDQGSANNAAASNYPTVTAWSPDHQAVWTYAMENPSHTLASGQLATVAAGDLDADGRNEIVLKAWYTSRSTVDDRSTTVIVLDAATGVRKTLVSVPAEHYGAVALVDVDGRPGLEIIVPGWNGSESKLFALRVDGSNAPGWPVTYPGQPTDSRYASVFSDVTAANLDADPAAEIVVGRFGFDNNGAPLADYPLWGLAHEAAVFGNFDDDAATEIVRGGQNFVVAAFHDTDGTFRRSSNPRSDENSSALIIGDSPTRGTAAVGDLTGDGRADVVIPSSMGRTGHATMRLYAYDGRTGQELTAVTRTVPDAVSYRGDRGYVIYATTAIDDLDCDGKTDLVSASTDRLFAWSLPSNFRRDANSWPVYQHDRMRTGNATLTITHGSACSDRAAPVIPAPTNVNVTALTTGSATMTFTDNTSNETKFVVERCTGGTAPACPSSTTFDTSANPGRIALTGLAPGTTYRYRVRAETPDGPSPASAEFVLTMPSTAQAAKLTGTVRRQSLFRPTVSNVTVTVWRQVGSDWLSIATATTDSNGSFTVPNLAAGTFKLHFTRSDYVAEFFDDASTLAAAKSVAVAPSGTGAISIRLVKR